MNEQQQNESGSAPKRPLIETSKRRPPLDSTHRLKSSLDKFHLLIGVTGSVATIKIYELIQEFRKKDTNNQIVFKVCQRFLITFF